MDTAKDRKGHQSPYPGVMSTTELPPFLLPMPTDAGFLLYIMDGQSLSISVS